MSFDTDNYVVSKRDLPVILDKWGNSIDIFYFNGEI